MTLQSLQQSLYRYDELAADPEFTRLAHPQLYRNKPRHGRRPVARHVENERRSVMRPNLSVSLATRVTSTVLTKVRPVMSEEQHSLRRLQAARDLEEWQGKGSRRFVVTDDVDDTS